jgi:hypothetical protein
VPGAGAWRVRMAGGVAVQAWAGEEWMVSASYSVMCGPFGGRERGLGLEPCVGAQGVVPCESFPLGGRRPGPRVRPVWCGCVSGLGVMVRIVPDIWCRGAGGPRPWVGLWVAWRPLRLPVGVWGPSRRDW